MVGKKTHKSPIKFLEFSRDGKYLVSGDYERDLIIWEFGEGCPVGVIEGDQNIELNSMAISPSARYIATGTSGVGDSIHLWDLKHGNRIASFDGPLGDIVGLAFTNDENYLLSGGGSYIQVWSLRSRKSYKKISENARLFPEDHVEVMGLTPDGQLLVCLYTSGVKVYDTRYWRLKLKVGLYEGMMPPLAIAPHGHEAAVICAGDLGSLVTRWSLDTGEILNKFHVPTSEAITFLLITPDNRQILVNSYGENTTLWDLETGTLLRTFIEDQQVTSMCVSPDGRSLVTAGTVTLEGGLKRAEIFIRDLTTGATIRTLS